MNATQFTGLRLQAQDFIQDPESCLRFSKRIDVELSMSDGQKIYLVCDSQYAALEMEFFLDEHWTGAENLPSWSTSTPITEEMMLEFVDDEHHRAISETGNNAIFLCEYWYRRCVEARERDFSYKSQRNDVRSQREAEGIYCLDDYRPQAPRM